MRKTFPFISANILSSSENLGQYSLKNYIPYLKNPQSTFRVPDTQTLMKSLIYFNFGGYLLLQNITVQQCFLYEPMLSDKRGMVMYGQWLQGSLQLKNVSISN
jgi:hypothetical protein